MSPAHIALVLRASAAGRQPEPSIDLVVSDPDVPAAACDTGVVMRRLFGKARKRVLAVGFVVHQGRTVFEEPVASSMPMLRSRLRSASTCGGNGPTLRSMIESSKVSRRTLSKTNGPASACRGCTTIPDPSRRPGRTGARCTQNASWSTGRKRSSLPRISLLRRRNGTSNSACSFAPGTLRNGSKRIFDR